MSAESRQEVIIDTSVLMNFVKVSRLDLLTEHPRYRFTATNHVRSEVTEDYPEQVALLEEAIASGGLREIQVTEPVEVEAFVRLEAPGRIGVGECSAIAVAANRGLPVAVDDVRAKKEARRFKRSITVLDTEAVMVSLIHENVLDVDSADAIKEEWEQDHRFKLKFESFEERV